ncbi:SUMF1/EgtB/PvdO family nonheme iron enzyme [Parasphaerochaeta coccoides]|uniref:Sulphatase-modifying factor protein n=1 Tax=Parasphaerochaeta coccoides (strain ATCC BAA-1237 / DSM 17374 / SPN1) TaxID=760011 RepID=F4GK35_PARC1|nr:SUMF1/EgtB/PvdO family nonheme iron enzyme [Parasphaerochaeta coccoides]AEC01807.1 Sulphatase-modifying factor protein [Parasphaerochaeta coccoides DSM 17374]
MKKNIGKSVEDPIVLPHVFGMRPGIYISIILAFIIILGIFLVAFLPGILKGGRNYRFTSTSGPVSVTVDGKYLGGTPFETFIPSGRHEVVYGRNGIIVASETFTTKHPVFLTWLFPRRTNVEVPVRVFSSDEITLLTDDFLSTLARRSLILSFDASYPFAPVFTPWARDMAAFATSSSADMVSEVFSVGVAFITSPELLEDAKQAMQLLIKYGFIIKQDILENAESVVSGTAGNDTQNTKNIVFSVPVPVKLSSSLFTVSGFAYAAGDFIMGDGIELALPDVIEKQINVYTKAFSLASSPVTEYQWALFMQENPYWSVDNKKQLVADGMVDESYLAGIYPSVSVPSHRPIRGISFHAAKAFTQWLSVLSGRHVYLPDEVQWSRAAEQVPQGDFLTSLSALTETSLYPSGMLGGVWEMTQTVFMPLARAMDYTELQTLSTLMPDDVPIILKGGSYISDSRNITRHTVGVAGPDECSDYMGFRVAWE